MGDSGISLTRFYYKFIIPYRSFNILEIVAQPVFVLEKDPKNSIYNSFLIITVVKKLVFVRKTYNSSKMKNEKKKIYNLRKLFMFYI